MSSNPSGGIPVAKGVYSFLLNDAPGVVAANTYVAAFNPPGSGIILQGLSLSVVGYPINTSVTPDSMLFQHITAVTGGTQVAAATMNRNSLTMPDPKVQVFTGNPTVTTAFLPILAFAPPISTGGGVGNSSTVVTPLSVPPVLPPGVGFVFRTTAGNLNQFWNIQFSWLEF